MSMAHHVLFTFCYLSATFNSNSSTEFKFKKDVVRIEFVHLPCLVLGYSLVRKIILLTQIEKLKN